MPVNVVQGVHFNKDVTEGKYMYNPGFGGVMVADEYQLKRVSCALACSVGSGESSIR
jgi:hypothetical protein